MPIIATIYGIKIYMNFSLGEHNPPHIHGDYNSKRCAVSLDGEVLNDRTVLESLPGVGRKTANVVLNNCFDVPAFAVDTHVSRVSKRLKIADIDDSPLMIEEKLMNYFPKDTWGKLHHQFIFFGRYKCKAIFICKS